VQRHAPPPSPSRSLSTKAKQRGAGPGERGRPQTARAKLSVSMSPMHSPVLRDEAGGSLSPYHDRCLSAANASASVQAVSAEHVRESATGEIVCCFLLPFGT